MVQGVARARQAHFTKSSKNQDYSMESRGRTGQVRDAGKSQVPEGGSGTDTLEGDAAKRSRARAPPACPSFHQRPAIATNKSSQADFCLLRSTDHAMQPAPIKVAPQAMSVGIIGLPKHP